MTLPVSRLVRVTVNLSPLAAARRSFGVLMTAGDSDVISGLERYRTYPGADEIATQFGSTAPETLAAQLYFGQSPRPATMMVGRWLRTATSAELDGGILNATQQLLSNFTSVTSGGFQIPIDESTLSLTGLNFSAAANLNAVAAIVDTALVGGSCIWNGSQFVIKSDSTGAGSFASGNITFTGNPSYGTQASATITLTGNPANGNSVVIQGTTVTFVTGTPSGNQVLIGVDANATASNLQTFLAASADTNLALMTYNTIGAITTLTARLFSTAGNSYTLTKTGANISVSGATFSGGVNPDTVTVNGTAITFVSINPTGSQVLVGATSSITATNLKTFLSASVDSNIVQATYSISGLVITVTAVAVGTGGNSFTLAKSSTSLTVSGGTLSGGTTASSVGYATAPVSGTDISTLFKITSVLGLPLIPGYNAETPVECAAVLANLSSVWYGLNFAASVMPTNDQALNVSAFIQGLDLKRIYGVTITDTSVLSSLVTTDLGSLMKAAGYTRSFTQYSANSYAIASFFGRAFSVNFNANRSTITLMYKQEPGVVAENLSTTQADVLKDKRVNVFTSYVNDTSIIQYGTMEGPAWFDEIHGLDWFEDAVQNACYNLLYTSTTKIPQTDAGVNQFVNAISGVCDQAINNGLVAPGVWNAEGFGQLERGQYLKVGYYIYAQPIDLQSQADRETRVSPPITVAIKLAGAIQELDVLINVNR